MEIESKFKNRAHLATWSGTDTTATDTTATETMIDTILPQTCASIAVSVAIGRVSARQETGVIDAMAVAIKVTFHEIVLTKAVIVTVAEIVAPRIEGDGEAREIGRVTVTVTVTGAARHETETHPHLVVAAHVNRLQLATAHVTGPGTARMIALRDRHGLTAIPRLSSKPSLLHLLSPNLPR